MSADGSQDLGTIALMAAGSVGMILLMGADAPSEACVIGFLAYIANYVWRMT